MPEEIEAKVRIDDPEAFRRRMNSLSAPAAGPVFEINRLFDDDAGRLRRSGAALRVREEFPAAGGPAARTLLTYKGPRTESRLKRRPEFETEVASAEAITAILEALGLRETFRYEKRRTAWRAGDCEVTLDEVPLLGWFAEIEGPSEAIILRQLNDLGLGGRPLIAESYVHLLADRLASLGRDQTKAVF